MKAIINKNREIRDNEPRLMINLEYDFVVLVTKIDYNYAEGFCVANNGSASWSIGHHSLTWCIQSLTDFNGSIKISNN